MDVAIIFGRLSVCLNYDPRVLTPGQAQAFMDAVASEFAKSAREGLPA
jgi:hypothetical protein